jgi:hypothetical protein
VVNTDRWTDVFRQDGTDDRSKDSFIAKDSMGERLTKEALSDLHGRIGKGVEDVQVAGQ